MTLELATALAESNRKDGNADLTGLRIKDGTVQATDMKHTITLHGTLTKGLDCYVDAKTFLNAFSGTNNPDIKQAGNLLTIKEGKTKADLMLLDLDKFIGKIDAEPKGTKVEPKNFLAAMDCIYPFFKVKTGQAVAQAYVVDGFLYCGDGNFLVRTPIETVFPKGDKKPINISKDVADMVAKIKQPLVELLIDNSYMTIRFETCWLQAARFGGDIDADYPALFKAVEGTELSFLPPEVIGSLKHICSVADSDDVLTFSPAGISLVQSGKVSWSISHPMTNFTIKVATLKVLLDHGTKYSFETPEKVVFQGKFIEGMVSTKL